MLFELLLTSPRGGRVPTASSVSLAQFLLPLLAVGFRRKVFDILWQVSQPGYLCAPGSVTVAVRVLVPAPMGAPRTRRSSHSSRALGQRHPKIALLSRRYVDLSSLAMSWSRKPLPLRATSVNGENGTF
ncbi:hypothetical protein ACIP5N_33785 [Streptomyces sp. NPDC088768]|uniref:hypothetical protein n=1 Tax=Streptomyces sp. NPDC088768 TaxID=3365894 RepID=UPI0037F72026